MLAAFEQARNRTMTDATQAGVGTAHLSSELDSDGPYTIHGVALGAGDVTVGSSGIKKRWPGEELKQAADSLDGQPLVKDHENNADGTIGTVTDTTYREGVGVLYEAEIAPHYEQLAKDIASGILEVSARAYHDPVDDLEEDDSGALQVSNVSFDNLAVVSQGASPSNTVDIGEAAAMAQGPEGDVAVMERGAPPMDAAELAAAFDGDTESEQTDEEELKHTYEIGDLIEWGDDNLGSVTGIMMDDGVHKYRVRVMARSDNGVEPTDETETVVAHNACKGPYVPRSDLAVDSDDESMSSEQPDDDAVEELENAWHTPDWDGLDDEREWSKPSMEDFDTDDMSEIDNHFIVSKTGEWPPENYSDLALPVVWPDGELSLDGLDSAHQMAGQVDGISDDMAEKLQSKINGWADEHFDEPVAGEEMADTDETGDDRSVNVAILQDDDPSQASTDGIAAQRIHSTTMTEIEYTNATEDELDDMDSPTVIEEAELEDLRSKASRAEELDDRLDSVNSTLDELADNQEALEDVEEDRLEELREYDDPTVLTDEEYEELTGLVDDIGQIFAEELAEYGPFDTEELQDRFTPLELKAKVEDHDEASVESELSTDEEVEPDGGTATSEELEQTDTEAEQEADAEAVREAVAHDLDSEGLSRQAEKVRNGDISLEEMGIDPDKVAEEAN
jgi:hypothetical protein